MQRTVDEVRQRMLHAWDGVQSLRAYGTEKIYRVAPADRLNHPEFLTPNAVSIEPYHYQAWWQAPHSWRHDRERPGHPFGSPHTPVSYIGVGGDWWVKINGVVQKSGTVAESQRTHQMEGDDLWFGRPYLSPWENVSVWTWLNPQAWANSLGLVINDGCYPLPDDVFHDPAIVHVIAGYWDDGGADLSVEPGQHLSDPNKSADDLMDTNIVQLWVDMRTGFCRRITGEGANGRSWDMIITDLTVNPVDGIAPEIFRP